MENYEKTLNAHNSLNNRVRSKRALICDHPQKFIFLWKIIKNSNFISKIMKKL